MIPDNEIQEKLSIDFAYDPSKEEKEEPEVENEDEDEDDEGDEGWTQFALVSWKTHLIKTYLTNVQTKTRNVQYGFINANQQNDSVRESRHECCLSIKAICVK